MTEADKEDSILVAVSRDGKYYLNQDKVNIDDLTAKQKLLEEKAKNLDKLSGADKERAEQELRDIQRQIEDIKLAIRLLQPLCAG